MRIPRESDIESSGPSLEGARVISSERRVTDLGVRRGADHLRADPGPRLVLQIVKQALTRPLLGPY